MNNYIQSSLLFDLNVYSIDTIKRALYRFTDVCSFDFSIKEHEIEVKIYQLDSSIDNNLILSKIRNEVLDQDLRDIISKETANIRTLILANAFSNTGLIEV